MLTWFISRSHPHRTFASLRYFATLSHHKIAKMHCQGNRQLHLLEPNESLSVFVQVLVWWYGGRPGQWIWEDLDTHRSRIQSTLFRQHLDTESWIFKSCSYANTRRHPSRGKPHNNLCVLQVVKLVSLHLSSNVNASSRPLLSARSLYR